LGAVLYADTTAKRLVVTLAPDGDGLIPVDVQRDVWSDLEDDWASTLALRRFTFPLVAIGGQTISAGKLGTTYVLADPWQVAPYEADHEVVFDGNLFTELATTRLVTPTVGAYTVTATRNLSTLVEVVESGTSGLTPTESAMFLDVWTRIYGGRLFEDDTTGKEKVLTAAGVPYSEADVWSDDGVTPYDGTAGIARRDGHVKP